MKMEKKRGRPYKFTPEQFEEAWKNYFAYCDDNPWFKNEVIKGGPIAGTIVKVPTQRPYTEIGFCVHNNLGEKYLIELGHTLEDKEDEESIKLSNILTRMKAKCKAQKFEGAVVGVFNANIIARDLGLTDKSETNVIQEQPLFGDDDEARRKKLDKLSLEEKKSLRDLHAKMNAE